MKKNSPSKSAVVALQTLFRVDDLESQKERELNMKINELGFHSDSSSSSSLWFTTTTTTTTKKKKKITNATTKKMIALASKSKQHRDPRLLLLSE
jgi:hypothetical protein